MTHENFIIAWIEAGNPHADLGSVRLVVTEIKELFKVESDGSELRGLQIFHNGKKQKITISLSPVPMMPCFKRNFTLGRETDASRLLGMIGAIVENHDRREGVRQKIKEAGERCAESTASLLIHDEFFDLMDVCSNISTRRKEIAILEKTKQKAVERLLTNFSVKTGIDSELILANSRTLLDSCCKMYNKDVSLLGA